MKQMKLNFSAIISLYLLSIIYSSFVDAKSVYVAPKLPSFPYKTFNIIDYHAISDDKTDNTKAIQTAIDAAVSAGGGQVIIPLGNYLTSPIQFGNNLNIHFDSDAKLKMLPIDRYPGGTTHCSNFIVAEKLHDIAITGKGTIDGQGSPWWKHAKWMMPNALV